MDESARTLASGRRLTAHKFLKHVFEGPRISRNDVRFGFRWRTGRTRDDEGDGFALPKVSSILRPRAHCRGERRQGGEAEATPARRLAFLHATCSGERAAFDLNFVEMIDGSPASP